MKLYPLFTSGLILLFSTNLFGEQGSNACNEALDKGVLRIEEIMDSHVKNYPEDSQSEVDDHKDAHVIALAHVLSFTGVCEETENVLVEKINKLIQLKSE